MLSKVRLHDGRLLLTTCFTTDSDYVSNGSPIISREIGTLEKFLDACRGAWFEIKSSQQNLKYQIELSNYNEIF